HYAFVDGALTDYATSSILYICLTTNKTYQLPESIRVIKDGAFDGSSVETLEFNEQVQDIESGAFKGADKLKMISNVVHNAYFSYENGALYNKDKTTIFIYLYINTAESFVMPESVTKVGDGAFENAVNLKQIAFQNDATIGIDAFKGTDLIIFGIGECYNIERSCLYAGIEYYSAIPFNSFQIAETAGNANEIEILGFNPDYMIDYSTATNLSTAYTLIYIPAYIGGKKVVSIAANAFAGTDYSGVIGYSIPDTVTTIGARAFAGSNAPSIVVGKNVTAIGEKAFESTYLREIYFTGDFVLYEDAFKTFANDEEETLNVFYSSGNKNSQINYGSSTTTKLQDYFTYFNEMGMNPLVSIVDYKNFTQEEFIALSLNYQTIDGSITITGVKSYIGLRNNNDLVIPETIGGLTVTSIGEKAFENNNKIIRLTIPNSVVTIGAGAISGCKNLTEIKLNNHPIFTFEYIYAFIEHPELTLTNVQRIELVGNLEFVIVGGGIAINADVLNMVQKGVYNIRTYNNLGALLFTFSVDTNTMSMNYTGISEAITFLDGYAIFAHSAFVLTGVAKVELTASIKYSIVNNKLKLNKTIIDMLEEGNHYLKLYYSLDQNSAYVLSIEGNDATLTGEAERQINYAEGILFGYESQVSPVTSLTRKVLTSLIVYTAVNTESAYVVPNSVVSIEDGAFYGINNLVNITIGANVQSIGLKVFEGCSALEKIIVNPSNVTFYNDESYALLKKNNADGKNTLVAYPAANKSFLYILGANSDVSEIADGAFNGSRYLRNLYIESYIISRGDNIFKGMNALLEVDGVRPGLTISMPFGSPFKSYCRLLLGVTVNEYTHKGCFTYDASGDTITGLKEHIRVEIIDGVPVYYSYICDETEEGHAQLAIPLYRNGKMIKNIGEYAFEGEQIIESIKVSDNIINIGAGAFANCDYLTKLEVASAGYTVISGVLFYGDGTLHTVLASAGYDRIIFAENETTPIEGEEGEEGEEPQSNAVPNLTITSVSENNKDYTVATIYNVTNIFQAAFHGNDRIARIVISTGIANIGAGAFSYCTALDDIEVASDSTYYESTSDALYNKYKTVLHTYLYTSVPQGNNDYLYIVDNGASFERDNIREISARAFEGTNVARLRLPSSLNVIKDRAFAKMPNLEFIYFESSVDNLVKENNVFVDDILGLTYLSDSEREAMGDRKIIAYGPN
ncbi:MAG: hypothetical protein EOM87_05955, partial [Clostridia bacterium]|nr:hypothetical protein [Clostridia bacterium]